MPTLQLGMKDLHFADLQTAAGLARLDQYFLRFLPESLCLELLAYRDKKLEKTGTDLSHWLIELAVHLDSFLAGFFQIEAAVAVLRETTLADDPVFLFKKHFVLREAKRRLKKVDELPSFSSLNDWLFTAAKDWIKKTDDVEQGIALFAELHLNENNTEIVEKIIHWCVHILNDATLHHTVSDWVSFHLPAALDYQRLVPTQIVPQDDLQRIQIDPQQFRYRDGFHLTDHRFSRRAVLDEIHYCVYCHKNDGDFCSKGFPVKRNEPDLGLKTNPLGEILTGCPLEEKISEMHSLKKTGHALGALAMIMVDNPMCPVTGHRICNDCMKACIYQKQDPVNIPQVETRILTDVLDLPWGVEIYDLLTKWNPLRADQYVLQPYTGQKVVVMGLGPAGFTMVHHLTMAGCAVLGVDGLKIEPLPKVLMTEPIYSFEALKEDLANRVMAGFGGVAEYGITVRWDKNFLKLIYLTLMRRPTFQVAGNVRFGGTLKVEDVWRLKFHHLVLAVGAGLPRELPVPGSMAPGMRQANDFLMALQLTGAAKKNSLANLQLRLPVVVIGGGLTGVDAATEAQAYYLVQIEKVLHRYETLSLSLGEARVRQFFETVDLQILDEMLNHARLVRAERALALQESRNPDFIHLLRRWGGVTIAYRRSMQESPAYQGNPEELTKALEEGIYYAEGLEPEAVILDEWSQVQALRCRTKLLDEKGEWHYSDQKQLLPARSILVATGAKPNIAYEYEHRGTFRWMNHQAYQTYRLVAGKLEEAASDLHCKSEEYGAFTSYDHEQQYVSFIGDTHPVFHGSVVKAVASAKRTYPKVLEALPTQGLIQEDYPVFAKEIEQAFSAEVVAIHRHTATMVELEVRAPLAAAKFQPGQLYRLQNYETSAEKIGDSLLQSEALAVIGALVPGQPDTLSLMIRERGVSSRLLSRLSVGQALAVMGPTGTACKIKTGQGNSVLILGDWLALVYLRSVGPALKQAGFRIILAVHVNNEADIFCQRALESLADVIIWTTAQKLSAFHCRSTDFYLQSDLMSALQQYATGVLTPDAPSLPFDQLARVYVMGSSRLLKTFKKARQDLLRHCFSAATEFIASVHGPMQCMLKGVCAQCLQWQLDPETGKRTKAVYACSWQDQPMDIVDLDNIDERLAQNRVLEILSNLWLDYLLLAVN